MIYIVIFILSLLFLKLALIAKKQNIFLYRLFIGVSVFIPCLLAALRADFIGSDTRNYIGMFKLAASSSNIFDCFHKFYTNSSVRDVMFILVNYIVAVFTDSIEVEFFVQEALVIVPVYAALLMVTDDDNDILLGVLLFYLYCYNSSYNIIRQSIALSFEVLSFAFLIRNNKKKFVFFALMAFLFHDTALIVYGIYFVYLFFETNAIERKTKSLITVIIIIVVVVASIQIDNVIKILYGIGLLNNKLYNYATNYLIEGYDLSIYASLLYLITFVLIVLNKKKLSEKISCINFFVLLSVLNFVILQMSSTIQFAGRFSYYFFVPCLLIVLPQLSIKISHKFKKKEFLYNLIIIVMFLFDWVWRFIIHTNSETYPYVLR